MRDVGKAVDKADPTVTVLLDVYDTSEQCDFPIAHFFTFMQKGDSEEGEAVVMEEFNSISESFEET